MKLRILLLAMALSSGALAQSTPIVSSVEPSAPSSRLATPDGEFNLELRVEPVAGQSLSAGDFVVTFLPLDPAEQGLDVLFRNGFESN